MGEAASKAGTLLNFAVGGEGRGYTDAAGNFVPGRRPRPELPHLRQSPLFPGDALVDELPTLTDIYEFAVGSPARGRKLPPLVGCCEPVDSTPWTASRWSSREDRHRHSRCPGQGALCRHRASRC